MVSLRPSHPDEAELVVATIDGEVVSRVPVEARLQLQYFCTRLALHDGGVPFSIGVTSAVSGEGVSFISNALAAVLSEDVGRSTCLLRVNWWSPDRELAEINSGLAGVLAGTVTVDDVLIETRFPRLSLITSGTVPTLQRALVARTEAMAAVLDELHTRFDHVIIDLPAIATSATALTFGAAAEAAVLVARQQVTRVDQIERAVSDLRHLTLLGVVLNDNHVSVPEMLQRRLLDA